MGLGSSSLNLSEEYVEEISEETGCKIVNLFFKRLSKVLNIQK